MSSIEDYLFNPTAFLIVNKTEVEGELSNLGEDIIRMSESISNSDSFETFKEASFFLFSNYFSGNGGSILSCVTLSEDEQGMRSSDFELVETPISIIVKFIQSIVKIISYFCHVFHKSSSWESWISVRKTCSNRLIYKDNVVAFYPRPIIGNNVERFHDGWLDEERT